MQIVVSVRYVLLQPVSFRVVIVFNDMLLTRHRWQNEVGKGYVIMM